MKLILTQLLFIICINSNAQLRIDIIEILSNSTRFTYVGIKYSPDYNLYNPNFDRIQNALATRAQRYEAGFKLVAHEYNKLKDLTLINLENIQPLNSHKIEVKKWMDENISKIDLSFDKNRDQVIEYITSIYKNQGIRDEILILNDIYFLYKSGEKDSPTKKCTDALNRDIELFVNNLKYFTKSALSDGFRDLFSAVLEDNAYKKQAKFEKSSDEIIQKYNSLKLYKKIANGWNDVQLISLLKIPILGDQILAYHTMNTKVYVTDNKVVMALKKDGTTVQITSIQKINNQKADILFPKEDCKGEIDLIPYTVYFF